MRVLPAGRDDEIVFASTHPDPKSKQYQDEENAFRASGKERRYSWDYDPEMDIYVYSEKTGALKRLTTARGYDAEGSYSPDGQWIVFSSMRDAYNRPLTDAEKKQLETEPELLRRDLHHARRRLGPEAADERRRATTAGRSSRTTARASSGAASTSTGLIADVWTMKPDGTRPAADHRLRLDELGALRASVGRVLHLRVEQARVRELRAVHGRRRGHEGAGARHLLRRLRRAAGAVARRQAAGVDVEPRAADRAGQLFLAQWNHEKALEALAQRAAQERPRPSHDDADPVAARVRAGRCAAVASPAADAAQARARTSQTLASERFDGRLTGSDGEAPRRRLSSSRS